MSVRRLLTAGALCVLAGPWVLAHKAAPGETAAAPQTFKMAAGGQPPAAPKTKPSPPAAAAPAVEHTWSAQEIELANARCTALLRGLDVVAVPEQPIRQGAECGTPAPVKLLSVGKSPQVTLSPPPILTCDLAAALARWMERDVQPLARKHLGAPVVRIDTMSSYSCRNAYGRASARLSEHGRANAIDIGAFVTAKGQNALVLADWGPTQRELGDTQVAAPAAPPSGPAPPSSPVPMQASPTKSKGGTATAAAPTTPRQSQPPPTVSPRQSQPPPPVSQPTVSLPPVAAARPKPPMITIPFPGLAVQLPPATAEHVEMLGLNQQSRLGGPKPPVTATIPTDGKGAFLRAIHRAACRTFTTVLGPEANAAHKNHFHVDMAERSRGGICE